MVLVERVDQGHKMGKRVRQQPQAEGLSCHGKVDVVDDVHPPLLHIVCANKMVAAQREFLEAELAEVMSCENHMESSLALPPRQTIEMSCLLQDHRIAQATFARQVPTHLHEPGHRFLVVSNHSSMKADSTHCMSCCARLAVVLIRILHQFVELARALAKDVCTNACHLASSSHVFITLILLEVTKHTAVVTQSCLVVLQME
mmetsp:Transcript_15818/g.37243  ORF Transcript_15818/g.37243 Transcript_15818/m.37243 type:complete len:202 (+) Transcript_15818:2181-2786(+)